MKTQTRTKERNDFVGYCNTHSKSFEALQQELSEYDIYLENLVEICRDTIFELCDKFEKKGIDFFSIDDDYTNLRNAIYTRLNQQLEMEAEIAHEIIELIDILATQTIFNHKQIALIDSAIEELITKHQQLCKFVKNYSLENDLEETLTSYLLDTNLEVYIPGYYSEMLKSLKKVLNKLGLSNQFSQIESQLTNLVENKEKLSTQPISQPPKPLVTNTSPILNQTEPQASVTITQLSIQPKRKLKKKR